ncbi:hypothetical protein HPULCUR_004342 [Helicostylum pulchrum]|uniref:F-box domain-containing protein n=1 Tax=Helicostylum pulchrum TaxID=562976 RepID=A0ABP9XWX6_9FUNG
MNKWDHIPTEILLNILDELELAEIDGSEVETMVSSVKDELEVSRTEWMLVNKQWYDQYLSKTYKFVLTSLDDTTFNNIVTSKFNPGRWVEQVTLKDMPIPPDFVEVQNTADPLISLMTHCPNVTAVYFSILNKNCDMNWLYISSTLSNIHNWKLKSIPLLRTRVNYSQYFECALQVHKTLQTLSLTKGMMFCKKYSDLKKFQALSVLIIDDVFSDICYLYELLLFAPDMLENLSVTFTQTQKKIPGIENSVPIMNISSIRIMKLVNYTPRADEEVNFFVEKFTKLESLTIYGYKEEPSWPSKQLSKTVARSLLNFIYGLREHYIAVSEIVDENNFINQYFTGQQFAPGSTLSVTINRSMKKVMADERFKISVRIEKDNNGINVSLVYTGLVLAEEMATRATSVLNTTSDSFNEIELSVEREFDSEMNRQSSVIFNTTRGNIRKVHLRGGVFNRITPGLSVRIFQLTHLKFAEVVVEENTLTLASKGLPNLAYLEFASCDFRNRFGHDSSAHVSLPASRLKLITFSHIEKENESNQMGGFEPITAVSIDISNEPDQSSYYLACRHSESNLAEVPRGIFRQFEDSFLSNDEEVAFIKIDVKSVDMVKLLSSEINITITK